MNDENLFYLVFLSLSFDEETKSSLYIFVPYKI